MVNKDEWVFPVSHTLIISTPIAWESFAIAAPAPAGAGIDLPGRGCGQVFPNVSWLGSPMTTVLCVIVLLILSITSCFHIMAHLHLATGRTYRRTSNICSLCLVEFARWRHRVRSLVSPIAVLPRPVASDSVNHAKIKRRAVLGPERGKPVSSYPAPSFPGYWSECVLYATA